MKEFAVTITETLRKTVIIEANSIREAEDGVREGWYDCEYTLDSSDLVDVEFEAVPA